MTSGAANDIERATELARNLVARFGMCDEFDMMALGTVQSQYLDGSYSMTCAQETYAAADRRDHQDHPPVPRRRPSRSCEDNRELLDKIAAYLLKKETITGAGDDGHYRGPGSGDRGQLRRHPGGRCAPKGLPPLHPRRASRLRPSTSTSSPSPSPCRTLTSPRRKSRRPAPRRRMPREGKSPKEPPADNGKPE